MNKELEAKWDAAFANPGTAIDVGNLVMCEGACSRDMTDSPETGGIIIGSYAYCGACIADPKMAEAIDEDRAVLPPGRIFDNDESTTFADFVRSHRERTGSRYIQVHARRKR